MASCPTKHPEDAAGIGETREDATEGGGRISHLGNVLSRGNTGGALVWGGDVGAVGSNGAEVRDSACGFPETGDKVKGKEAEGRFLADGGGGQSTSGSGYTTATDLLGQETGNSGGLGVPMTHF